MTLPDGEVDGAELEVEALVREGVESGPAVEMTKDDFEVIRAAVHARRGQCGTLPRARRRRRGP